MQVEQPSASSLSPNRQIDRQIALSQQIDWLKSGQWLLVWLIVLVWYVGAYFVSTQMPLLMRWSDQFLTQPLALMSIWFFVSIAIRVSIFLIQRSINAWQDNPRLVFGDAKRKALRAQTISGVLQGIAFWVAFGFGVLLTAARLGWPISSLLAGSAVIGLALSFGAQNLLKDLVNGCLILLEDQFAVGDVISANGETGLVETLNLRLTQIRNAEGMLISIPNSSIAMVKNLTSSWARINMGIEVAYDTDLDLAIATITQTANQLSQDPQWQSFILEPPQMLGVDEFGASSITIRLWLTTQPQQQWPVGREFRRRLKQAFDREGISIPFPQQSIWFKNALTNDRSKRNDEDAQ
ncbi:MAG: mechanosensitive ion channel family protein [Cyanobacteria bacterium J06649_4]